MTTSVQAIKITQAFPNPSGNGETVILENVNFQQEGSGIIAILGPSGCGKSTFMKMFGGIRPDNVAMPTAGKVLVNESECHGPHDDVVTVFQSYFNFPHLSVWDNVSVPFKYKLWKDRFTPKEQAERIKEVIEAVGLTDKVELRPSQLSGGQNQRVALARALVLRPKIILMDEPFGALDPITRKGMQKLLIKLQEENGCLIFFITHDVEEALLISDKTIVFSTRPASIVKEIPVQTPKAERTEEWLNEAAVKNVRNEILELLA